MCKYSKYILYLLIFFPLYLIANPIRNVRASQEGQNIVLLYDLEQDIEVSTVIIDINGTTRRIPATFLMGDIGKTVIKGNDKRIVYNLLADYIEGLQADNISFIIDASHEFVDLGLSVKWATCNVGASKPEECGDYFAWGETTPKTNYSWSTYRYCKGVYATITKYCTSRSYGSIDRLTQLELSDDAAHVNWGRDWRMPTYEEQKELRNKCIWKWTTQNGVNGYQVISKLNGNSIFLPATGYRYANSVRRKGKLCFLWSSSLFYDQYAFCLTSPTVVEKVFNNYRYYGLCVRPVCL